MEIQNQLIQSFASMPITCCTDQTEFNTTIDDLPDELPLIFEYLPLKDLIICTLVCKKFRFYVSLVKIRELIINNQRTEKAGELTWFHTDDPMMEMNVIKNHPNLQAYLDRFRIKYLTRLCLIESESLTKPFIERLLNRMQQLEHLELTINRSDNKSGHVMLELPNLQTFKLFSLSDKYGINSPKLKNVQLFMGPNEIDFSHPQSIKYLEVKCVLAGPILSKFNLTEFPNLDVLRVSTPNNRFNSRAIVELYSHAINSLPNLSKLYFDRPYHSKLCSRDTKNEFDLILNRRNLFHKELKIYFLNILLENGRNFDYYYNYVRSKFTWLV